MKRYIQPEVIKRGSPGDPPVKRTARQWLADAIRPKDEAAKPDASVGTPPAAAKPAKKPAIAWGTIRDAVVRGAGQGVDKDGQVLSPSSEQRRVAGRLNAMFPRGDGT